MTTYQQTEIETVLAILDRKHLLLSKNIKDINRTILNNSEPFSTTTEIQSASTLLSEITTLLDTLTILNDDRR